MKSFLCLHHVSKVRFCYAVCIAFCEMQSMSLQSTPPPLHWPFEYGHVTKCVCFQQQSLLLQLLGILYIVEPFLDHCSPRLGPSQSTDWSFTCSIASICLLASTCKLGAGLSQSVITGFGNWICRLGNWIYHLGNWIIVLAWIFIILETFFLVTRLARNSPI